MPGIDPAKGARDTGRTGRGIGEGPDPRDRGGGVGGTKKAGNATVADHMIATGRISVPSIGPKGVAQGNYNSQDDAYNDYAKAIGDYETRSWGGKLLDGILGGWLDQQAPISQNPRTFANGTYHTFSNPGSIIGGLAGGMVNPAVGLLTGQIGGRVYNAFGGKNLAHGGYSQPDTGVYSDPDGGWGAAASGDLGLGSQSGASSDNNDEYGNSWGYAGNGYDTKGGLLGLGAIRKPAFAGQGLLGLGTTSLAPAQSQLNQSNVPQRAQPQWNFGTKNIPGPSPYSIPRMQWS